MNNIPVTSDKPNGLQALLVFMVVVSEQRDQFHKKDDICLAIH